MRESCRPRFSAENEGGDVKGFRVDVASLGGDIKPFTRLRSSPTLIFRPKMRVVGGSARVFARDSDTLEELRIADFGLRI
jgi:hypothetical protein